MKSNTLKNSTDKSKWNCKNVSVMHRKVGKVTNDGEQRNRNINWQT